MSFFLEFLHGALLVVLFVSVITVAEGLYGNNGGILTALGLLGILVLMGESFLGVTPEFMKAEMTIGHVFGVIITFIIWKGFVVRKIRGKIQVDGEPRFKRND